MEKLPFAKKILCVILSQVVIYLMLFIVLPLPHPNDSYRQLFTSGLTTIFVSIIGIIFFVDKIRFWAIGVPIMYGLIVLYHPEYAYGIGWSPPRITPGPHFPTLGFGVANQVFLMQCILCWLKWCVVKIIKRVKKTNL